MPGSRERLNASAHVPNKSLIQQFKLAPCPPPPIGSCHRKKRRRRPLVGSSLILKLKLIRFKEGAIDDALEELQAQLII